MATEITLEGQPYARRNHIRFDEDKFLIRLKGLMDAACAGSADIKQRVAEVVETYQPEQLS